MVTLMQNPKRAFLEALLLAAAVFVVGILLGVSFESSRLDVINDYYSNSEISLMDSIAIERLAGIGAVNCSEMLSSNVRLADKIYEESYALEKYEESGKITDNLKLAHKKYDSLRTLLWINTIIAREKCPSSFSSVVYLYEYQPEKLEIRAMEIVWSRILSDLKQKQGDKMILIPISVSSNISSLDSLARSLNVTKYPAVIINEKQVIYKIESVSDLEKYLK